MPCPYNIILGRDTALPSPLSCLSATGIDITCHCERSEAIAEILRLLHFVRNSPINVYRRENAKRLAESVKHE